MLSICSNGLFPLIFHNRHIPEDVSEGVFEGPLPRLYEMEHQNFSTLAQLQEKGCDQPTTKDLYRSKLPEQNISIPLWCGGSAVTRPRREMMKCYLGLP
jgi:hypothetical protein